MQRSTRECAIICWDDVEPVADKVEQSSPHRYISDSFSICSLKIFMLPRNTDTLVGATRHDGFV